eukprot:2109573-Pyramimonas_sp.AAC.1
MFVVPPRNKRGFVQEFPGETDLPNGHVARSPPARWGPAPAPSARASTGLRNGRNARATSSGRWMAGRQRVGAPTS